MSQLSRDRNEKKRTHESKGNRVWGGSQLSRDQNNKRENTWKHRKQRVGRVPVKPRPKRKKENTWEQRKKRVRWVPVKPGPKQKERAHESRERRGWVSPSWAGTETLQTRNTWDAVDRWFRCNDSNYWLSGHRNQRKTCTSEKEVWVTVKPGPNQKEREHIRAEKEGGGWMKQRKRKFLVHFTPETVVWTSQLCQQRFRLKPEHAHVVVTPVKV